MPEKTVRLADKGNTKLIAHRGLSGLFPENTLLAFKEAAARSYYGIETDIWRTKDGKFVCIHDGRTGRVAKVNLPVEKTDLAALRALVLGGEQNIPTPEEYLEVCVSGKKHCVVELKSSFTDEEVKRIMAIFSDWKENTCYISFDMGNLEKIKKADRAQCCQFLAEKWDERFPETLAKRGLGLDIDYRELNDRRAAALKRRGVELNCWTVDNPEYAKKLIEHGVDYITTNILE